MRSSSTLKLHPNFWKVFWNLGFFCSFLRGLILPFPLKAHFTSLPVKAWKPRKPIEWFSKICSYIRDWPNSPMLLSSIIKENRDREGIGKLQEDEKYICITAANKNCSVTMILCPLDIICHTSVSFLLIGKHGMFFLAMNMGSIFWRQMMNMSVHSQIHTAAMYVPWCILTLPCIKHNVEQLRLFSALFFGNYSICHKHVTKWRTSYWCHNAVISLRPSDAYMRQ